MSTQWVGQGSIALVLRDSKDPAAPSILTNQLRGSGLRRARLGEAKRMSQWTGVLRSGLARLRVVLRVSEDERRVVLVGRLGAAGPFEFLRTSGGGAR